MPKLFCYSSKSLYRHCRSNLSSAQYCVRASVSLALYCTSYTILVARNKRVTALFGEVLFITGGQSVTGMLSSFPHLQHKRSFMAWQFSSQVRMDFHSHTTTIFLTLPTYCTFYYCFFYSYKEGKCVYRWKINWHQVKNVIWIWRVFGSVASPHFGVFYYLL
jgi:hypothetical protein